MAFLNHTLSALGALLIAPLTTAAPALSAEAASPIRVVSQTVGTDELLLAVAAPEQIAALSHLSRDASFSRISAEAQSYPQITYGDAETILRFHPTLVLVSDYSRPELVEQLRRAGVTVLSIDRYDSLDDALDALRTIAEAIGDEPARQRAAEVIRDTRARVAALKERLAGVTPVRVIAPSTYGVIAGANTTFQDICDHAGADNLAASIGGLSGHSAPPVESLLRWPIETVVLGGTDPIKALAPYSKLSPYAYLSAVKDGHVALIEPWALGCVSHLRVRAYEQLARQLHPERFTTEDVP